MVNSALSRKIKVVSFIAMVAVVMIHSHALGTFENPSPWCIFLQTLLFRAITSWAVPFFFVVSGFFIATSAYFRHETGYKQLIERKMRTLLVPYLLWTIIGSAISVPLIMGNNYIMHRGLFERTFLANGFGWGAIDSFLGISSNGPSGNLALWYVRTLLIFFAFAPLWRFVLKLNKTLTAVCGLLLVVFCSSPWIPYTGLRYSSFGWLFLGVSIGEFGAERVRLPRWLVVISGGVYIALSLYVASGGVDHFSMMPISGILFWWGLYDWLLLSDRALPSYFSMSFWVYCLHGVITSWFLASTSYLLGKTDLVAMFASATSICGSLAICLTLGMAVKRYSPKAYTVLSGGR